MYIGTTRFNNTTWQELIKYKESEKIKGCIYGFPLRLTHHIPVKGHIFILEMNNEENKIMGVGIIENWIDTRKYRRIYRERNYNRYIYRGCAYMSRDEMIQLGGVDKVNFIDYMLFKGYDHLKRGQSVTEVSFIKKHSFKERFSENMVDYLLSIFQNKYVNK